MVLLVSPHLGIHILPIVAQRDIRKRMRVIWVEDLHEGGIGTTKGHLTEIVKTVAAKGRGGRGCVQAASARQLRADGIETAELVEHGYGKRAAFRTKVYGPVVWDERSPLQVGLVCVELVVDRLFGGHQDSGGLPYIADDPWMVVVVADERRRTRRRRRSRIGDQITQPNGATELQDGQ